MIMLTVMPLTADSPLSSPSDVRKATKNAAKTQLAGALQKEVVLTEIETVDGTGFLYHLTDRNPETGPGDYREGDQGMILIPGHIIAATIFTHTGDAAIVTEAYDTLKTLHVVAGPKAAVEPDRLTVTEGADTYEITVPVSRLLMVIPKQHFVQVTDSGNGGRRYFQLKDAETHVIVSGWFESQDGFPGIQKFWTGETAAWTEHKLPMPESSEFKKIGNWDTVVYQMPQSSGSNPHIRAHWVQAGTWIDLHLSMASDLPKTESEQLLEALLGQIRVSARSGS
jgi:hypothetical protein